MPVTTSQTTEYAYILGKDERPNVASPVTIEEEGEVVETVKYRHFVTLVYELQDANHKRLSTVSKNHMTGWFNQKQSVSETAETLAPIVWEWDRQNRIELSGFDIGEYNGE